MNASLHASSISNASAISIDALSISCWQCNAPLSPIAFAFQEASGVCTCRRCGSTTAFHDRIWRSLSAQEAAKFERFITEYESVRAAEERGSDKSAYYLALPFRDLSGKLNDQWMIRAATFRYMARHLLTPLGVRTGHPLRILDLGAGNGWLSYRLALLGHQPVAVDLLTNKRDGLGASEHYAGPLASIFPCVQADVDRLPFADALFDLVIFNASFHYSPNYATTLTEALRCMRKQGQIVIADTPWYRDEAAGARMIEEKQAHFKTTYGFASNSLSSQEFLTPQRLDHLSRSLKIKWQTLKPFYGIDWMLRPLRAKLAGRRPPSKFRIFLAEVAA